MTAPHSATDDGFLDVDALEDRLSEPTDGVIEALAQVDGDIMILGAGGKMGPTLARMAERASRAARVSRRVIGVSRFSSEPEQFRLEAHGVETVRADLLEPSALEKLPDVPNVIFMAGMKFGTTGNEPLTWAMNTHLPAAVCQRFGRSRIVAFSTGNVYGMCPVTGGGSVETDRAEPDGEYAMSCLGRERIVEYFGRTLKLDAVILRLNYAVEMRYGVLLDLARQVRDGQTVDMSMGYVNAIWQGDANAMALAALRHATCPPLILNIAGPECLSVRAVCERFAKLMDRPARFASAEADDALLSNGTRAHDLIGPPRVGADQLIEWTARWVMRGGESLDRPTHFDVRDGSF